MSNIFLIVLAVGMLSFLGFMIAAISSRSRYEDTLPAFLFVLAIVLSILGALGLLITGAI